MATERIIIEVSERGSRTVRRSLDDIGDSAKRAEGGVQLLRRALGLIGGGLAVQQLVQMADAYTNIQNRLKLVTTGTANLARVTNELFEISNRTRSSYEGTASLYARVALSARSLGVSQQELLQFTESLNQAVILSGASMREAEGALIQLSQGLASGTLQGDELRSVLEQLPFVADVIADHLGVTRGELRKMGSEGQITAQNVLEAFRAAREEIGGKFAETIPTIGQSFQVLKNRALELWGEFATTSSIAQGLASALLWVAENLDNIVPLALAVAAIFASWTVGASIMAVLGPMLALERALGATTTASALFSIAMKGAQRAVIGLTAAIAANPIGAIAVAITAVIALLYTFSDDIKVTEDGVVSLRDVFVAAFQIIMESLSGVIAFFQEGWQTAVGVVNAIFAAFGTTVSEVFNVILQLAKVVVNAFIGFWVLAFRTVQLAWNNFPGLMDVVFTAVVNLGAAAAEALLNAWQIPLRGIAGALSYIDEEASAGLSGFLDNITIRVPRRQAGAAGRQFASDFAGAARDALTQDYVGDFAGAVMDRARLNASQRGEGSLNPASGAAGIPGAAGAANDAAGATRDLANAEREAQRALQDFLTDIDREIALLGLSNREREVQAELFRLEDQLKRKLTDTEKDLATARINERLAASDNEQLREFLKDLENENILLSLNADERERRAAILQLERQLQRSLTDEELAAVRVKLDNNAALREQGQVLDSINGPLEEVRRRQEAVNILFADGKIQLRDYKAAMLDLQLTALESFNPTNFSEAFVQQWLIMQTAADQALTTIGTKVGEIFGPGGTLIQGIGDAVAGAIVFGESFTESINNVARQILSQLISSLVQIGLNMILQATLGKALLASSTAATVAAASATSAAWAPAAALASLATLGTNAAPAAAALIGTTALSAGLASLGSIIPGFEDGGFTGMGGRSTVAGVVHGQEFVAHAEATRRFRPELEAMNRGDYRRSGGVSVRIENYAPGVEHEVRERSDGEIEIIARKVMQREAASLIANDLSQPNSRTRKALEANTTAQARRG